MKILRLLNKKNCIIFFIFIGFIFNTTLYSEEQPIDIWNVNEKKDKQSLDEKNKTEILESDNNIKVINESNIYKLQTKKKNLRLNKKIL